MSTTRQSTEPPPSRPFTGTGFAAAVLGFRAVVTHLCRCHLDAHSIKTRVSTPAVLSALLLSFLVCGGCGSPAAQQTVDRVRAEVATILQKDSAQIDLAKPLVAQGAHELDTVAIVMAVEKASKVEMPDRTIGENVGEVSKTLTVRKFAEITSRRLKTK
jgi:acyl carrier protein